MRPLIYLFLIIKIKQTIFTPYFKDVIRDSLFILNSLIPFFWKLWQELLYPNLVIIFYIPFDNLLIFLHHHQLLNYQYHHHHYLFIFPWTVPFLTRRIVKNFLEKLKNMTQDEIMNYSFLFSKILLSLHKKKNM